VATPDPQQGNTTFRSARIVERRDLSDDLWVIRVDPDGEFPYRAGQYATLGIGTAEKHYERPYSIVSAPHEKYPEFFIELVPGGQVTPRLHRCGVGDRITLRPTAKGNFALDFSGERPNHLMVATVTGVSPFVGFVRSLRHEWKDTKPVAGHQLYVLEGASRSWELGYSEELGKLCTEVPWLTYLPTISRQWEDKTWNGETGRVDDVFRKYADMWNLTPENTCVYLCGHPGMIDSVKGIASRRGWQQDTVKAEAFFVPHHEGSEIAS
jgi:ferredoxin--NADP+ reductase